MGDYSNIKFRKEQNFTSVNSQQGKVQLDSDINEQTDINRYLQRTTLNDVVGKYGTPSENPGFEIIPNDKPLVEFKNIPGKDSLKLAQFIQNNFGIVLIPHELSSKLRSFDGYSKNHDPEDEAYDQEIISLASTIFEVENGPESVSISAQSIDGLHQLEVNVTRADEKCNLKIDEENVYEFLTDRDENDGLPTKLFARSFSIGSGNYYVNGTLCQNFKEIESSRQHSLPSLYGSKVYIFNWKNIVAYTENKNNEDYYNIIRFLENFGIEWLLDDPNKDIASFFTFSESEIKITSAIDINKHVIFKRASDTNNVTLECSEPEFSFDNFIIVKNDENDQNDLQVYYDGIYTPAFPVSLNVKENSYFIVYLDVWDREISSIEDPSILETALGGIETTTRTKTISQVKLLHIKDIYSLYDRVFTWPSPNFAINDVTLDTEFLDMKSLLLFLERHFNITSSSIMCRRYSSENISQSIFQLDFRFDNESLKDRPERSLFNKSFNIVIDKSNLVAYLYVDDKRVTEFIIKKDKNDNYILYHPNKILIKKFWDGYMKQVSQRNDMHIKLKETEEPNLCDISGNSGEYVGSVKGNYFYRLQVNNSGHDGQATFKYSINNAYMKAQVTEIESLNLSESRLIMGRNNFGSNMNQEIWNWVEISDDRRELLGIPGSFVQLRKDSQDLSFTFNNESVYGDPINKENYPLHFNPKLIIWNNNGNLLKIDNLSNSILFPENNIEIIPLDSFHYTSGNHWNFAIRNGKLESFINNMESINTSTSSILHPTGFNHRYAPLGLLRYSKEEKKFHMLEDLRVFFHSQVENKINTGLINLLIKPTQRRERINTVEEQSNRIRLSLESMYGPFSHYFTDALKPPSIILSLEQIFPPYLRHSTPPSPSNWLEDFLEEYRNYDSALHMEDYSLMQSEFLQLMVDHTKIKAFGINNKTFFIKLENDFLNEWVDSIFKALLNRLNNNDNVGNPLIAGYLRHENIREYVDNGGDPELDDADLAQFIDYPRLSYLVKIRWTAIFASEKQQQTNIGEPILRIDANFAITDDPSNEISNRSLNGAIAINLDYEIINLVLTAINQTVFVNVDFYLSNQTILFSGKLQLEHSKNSSFNNTFLIRDSKIAEDTFMNQQASVDLRNFVENGSFLVVTYSYFDFNTANQKEVKRIITLKVDNT
ncbi:MAG: DUF6519 domain-containing protein [Candidatus Nitrosocosmicus sp.]